MPEVIVTPVYEMNNVSVAPLLSMRHVDKIFGNRNNLTHALDALSLDVMRGEFVAIMGPSGSGKTTLLNCVATIDRPSSGQIVVNGQEVTHLNSRALAKFRRDELGFIFQDSNLLDVLTGFENISLALTIKGVPSTKITSLVNEVAEQLGVASSLNQYPSQMSGGQRQRVAAARAIVSDPSLILADEPTGALDSHNATIMLETLEGMNKNLGATILMVTHDAYAASFTDRTLFLSDGRIFNEIRRGALSREEYFTRIMEVVTFLGGEARHAV